ncbi:venom allergen 5-like [Haematobia irritans]|uniref:venom allergen 5-like n=1 Tax=Haematobia irritans TaxID=7368 RepID=UPI003F501243
MSVNTPITYILFLSSCLRYIAGVADNSIFPNDFCQMHCYGQPHTLCLSNKRNLNDSCLLTKSPISEAQNLEMKKILIMGHNGLRNRIAERMMVANMVEMVWQDELATMAMHYLESCRPYETDQCAMLTQQSGVHEQHSHFSGSFKSSYHHVAQNRYVQKKIHYPNLLIENALRSWYMEKDSMKPPTVEFNIRLQNKVGHIVSENNFTHLASPLTTHFGCAFNKIVQGYILICNYHPYRRREDLQVDFFHGDPGSLCPISRPLRNRRESLANLCIGVERNSVPSFNDLILLTYISRVLLLFNAIPIPAFIDF